MNTEERLKKMMEAARVESEPAPTDWNAFAGRAHRSLLMRRAGLAGGALALIAVGAVAAIVFTSNPVNETPIAPATASPEASPTPTSQEPTVIEIEPSEQELWYVQGERLSWGAMVFGGEVPADIAPEDDPIAQRAAFWLDMLVSGVPGPYQEDGATTAIPEGAELLNVSRNSAILQVNLSSEFESGGGSLSILLRSAQVVYTATQFDGIEVVRFFIEGRPVESIGGEGLVAEGGLTRRDFMESGVTPNIVVEAPKPGDEFPSNGAIIRGFANVFEANVNIRVLDAQGNAIFETSTTATCGSGCWGDFEEAFDFDVDSRQEGRVEVLTYSAEDGSERDVVSIPVVLVP